MWPVIELELYLSVNTSYVPEIRQSLDKQKKIIKQFGEPVRRTLLLPGFLPASFHSFINFPATDHGRNRLRGSTQTLAILSLVLYGVFNDVPKAELEI